MSDKTCGTCLCGQRPRVWCSCADEDKPANRQACGDYIERAESVEQVAREMLRDLRVAAAKIDVERWRDGVYGQADRHADRLRALGVVE